ncbi:MAG: CRISPR-associated protein Csx18 [Cyanobacteria bacterium J06642_2]
MYTISGRAAFVRNAAVAIGNGSITLILLLIAPMGLAGVISNTLMVTIASFAMGTAADQVVKWLAGGRVRVEILEPGNTPGEKLRSRQNDDLYRD